MTPQELKASILQLAIQGKLVPQLSEEGTGEELYSSIVFTVKKMLKPISDDEIPFDIPSSWKWIRHNELFEIVGGSQPPKSKFEDNPQEGYVRLYQIRDYGEKPVPVFVPQNLVSKFTKKGDILLARYGASVGKVFWAEDGAYNVAMAKSTPLFKKGTVLPTFVYYYYLAPLYQTLVRNNSRSAQAGFNKEDLNGLLFPLPPLAEQQRIVAKIEELLPLIDRYEQAWSRLEDFNKRFPVDMQKSILQMAIQGKLVPQIPEEGTGEELFQQIQAEKQALIKSGKIKKEKPLPEIAEDEIPFDIPESWKWVRLESILHAINAGKSFKCHEMAPDDRQAGVVKVSSVTWGEFDENESKTCFSEDNWIEEYAIRTGDFLLSRANTKKLVGACVIVRNISKRLMLSDKILRLTFSSSVSKDYILFCLRSPIVRAQIEATATGTSDSMKNISQNDIRQYQIPLPPLAEQKRIVAKLEEILPLCERLK